jgi:uncharacterized protein (DUF433 family)
MNLAEIEINPRVCGGKPVIAGTRIPVTVILDQFADGASTEDMLQKFPELTVPQITAALRYCHSVIEHTELEPALP